MGPRRITESFLSLFGVQLAQNMASLVTVPYLTRTIGIEVWGLVVIVQAFRMLTWPLIEFGFVYSATRQIARFPGNREQQRAIVASVIGAHILMALLVAGLVALMLVTVPVFRNNPDFILFGVLAAMATGMAPWWFFQGIERLRLPAGVAIATRLLAAAGIFLFVHDAADGWKVVALDASAGLIILVWMMALMGRIVPIRSLNWRTAVHTLIRGLGLAIPRIAERWQEAVAPMLVGLMLGPAAAGIYGGADKVVKIWRTAVQSFLRAAYPRACLLAAQQPQRAFLLRKRLGWILAAVGTLSAAGLFVLSPGIVRYFLGPEYDAAIPVLRTLVWSLPFILISGALGVLWILPLGGDRSFRHIALVMVAIQIVIIGLAARMYSVAGVTVAVVVVEVVRYGLFRTYEPGVVRRGGDKAREDEEQGHLLVGIAE